MLKFTLIDVVNWYQTRFTLFLFLNLPLYTYFMIFTDMYNYNEIYTKIRILS